MPHISEHHFYGRRRNRSLHTTRQSAFDQVSARYFVTPPDKPAGKPFAALEPAALFGDFKPAECWLEIGFGQGEHLTHQAALHRTVGLLGIEPFINGVALAAVNMVAHDIDNIRIYPDDAMHVLPQLADGSFTKIFLYFPDPWPKTRHHKRRFIQRETVALFARLLKPQGVLHVATDIPELAEWMRDHILGHPAFDWTDARRHDVTTPPANWVMTKYQDKAMREGRTSQYMDFVRS